MKCKCGEEAMRVELRVVTRCANGHFVSSVAAPPKALVHHVGPEMASSGQVRAFHAKCTAIDRMHSLAIGTTKARVLAVQSKTSASDLSGPSMTQLLDELEAELVSPSAA